MKFFFIVPLILVNLLISSCQRPKQYNSCDEMSSSLYGKRFNDLVSDWGEPSKKDYFPGSDSWYVTWEGVGVNGKDKEIIFKNDVLRNYEPHTEFPSTCQTVFCDAK